MSEITTIVLGGEDDLFLGPHLGWRCTPTPLPPEPLPTFSEEPAPEPQAAPEKKGKVSEKKGDTGKKQSAKMKKK